MDDFFNGDDYVDDLLDEVEKNQASTVQREIETALIELYPLDSHVSNGFSSLSLVELASNYTPGGPAAYNPLDTFYAKSGQNDERKLLKSAALLEKGEQFALRAVGYQVGHPPLYLRYYKKNENKDSASEQPGCLLSNTVDEMLNNMVERQEHAPARRSRSSMTLLRKRKRQTRDHNTDDSNESWLIKYQPRYFSDLLTDEAVNVEVLEWLRSWKCSKLYSGNKKSQSAYQQKDKESDEVDVPKILLLGGPAGVGKSTVVNVLARHCGFDVVEINASEDRSKEKVLPTIKGIVTANSISKNRPNLCLLEEVDGLHAAEGRVIGALKDLNQKNMIKRPIVCICNELYDKNLRELRQISKVIVVESCYTEALKHRLANIAELEGYQVDEQLLDDLIKLHHNDIRSCITALEFIIKNPHLADNLEIFAKDRSQDIITFLRDLFNQRSTPQAMRRIADAFAASVGSQTLSHLVLENVAKIGTRSMFNAVALYDIMAQGDALYHNWWMEAVLTFVKMMQLKSAFKFILPNTLHSHSYGQRLTKNMTVVKVIKRESISTYASEVSLSFVSIVRNLKELDLLWEAFAPQKATAITRLIKLSVLLKVYGISVLEHQGNLALDPPLLSLINNDKAIGNEALNILQHIQNVKSTNVANGKPKNLKSYLQEINQLGYAKFLSKYASDYDMNINANLKRICRKNGNLVAPITFEQLLLEEYQRFSQLLKDNCFNPDAKTYGMYKYFGERCNAVRYIINDI
uniref:AAA+ ATPase domain-containing protein n=1 Tax=Babesia bovis TaxID=5865 RepID=A7ANZ3_BABBO|eukprot:XP_001611845.1 hypothetical protein [Babesia bovis T2Bo]